MIELDSSVYPPSAFSDPTQPPIHVERRPLRLRLASAQPVAVGNDLVLGHVLGHLASRTFLAFTAAVASVAIVATGATTTIQLRLESAGLLPTNTGDLLTTRIGVIGSAVLALAALVVAYRAAVTRTPAMAPIALVVLGPAAWWNWGLFANAQPSSTASSALATWLLVGGAVAVAFSLIVEAYEKPRWLGLYCGLGATGVAVTAVTVALRSSTDNSVALPLLMMVAGLACLYGTVVEGEAVRRQLSDELLRARAMADAHGPEMVGAEPHHIDFGAQPVKVLSQPDLDLLAAIVPDQAGDLSSPDPDPGPGPGLDPGLSLSLDSAFGPAAREPWTWPQQQVARSTPPLPPPSLLLRQTSDAIADHPDLSDLNQAGVVWEDAARETAEIGHPIVPLSLWPGRGSPGPKVD